jgi:hypothetical protein
MDRGPWALYYKSLPGDEPDVVIGVMSGDFHHDVALTVSGDFPSTLAKANYCHWLLGVLNAASEREAAQQTHHKPESD